MTTDTINHSQTAPQQASTGKTTTRIVRGLFISPLLFLRAHLFSITVIAILMYGWSQRNDNYISAENGVGYVLGIVGVSMMLLVLLYPLSKSSSLLTRWVPIRYWFRIHMLFGILGPMMILFHSNFQLGSTNSSVALISMLLVAGSGLVGRYFYTNIHHGLYGKRITLEELKRETENKHTDLLRIYEMDEKLNNRIASMENKALKNYTGIITSLLHVISLAIDSHRLQNRFARLLKASGIQKPNGTLVLKFVRRYTITLRRIAAFRVYERLFSLWHVLHIPVYVMMIITAVIHIFAVHMY